MTRDPPHRFRKSSKVHNRVLRSEPLEARALLSGNGLSPWFVEGSPPDSPAMVGASTPGNKAPTVAKSIVVNGNAPVTGNYATLAVLGNDDGGEAKLVYNWSVTSAPAGGSAAFAINGNNNAKNTVATFSKAGTYALTAKITDGSGLWVSAAASIVVKPTLKSIQNLSNAAINVSGTSLQLPTPTLIDQFGNAITGVTLAWSTSSRPSGATAPTFTNSGSVARANFGIAGYYTLTACLNLFPGVSFAILVSVNQTLTSIAVSPNTTSIYQGASQQFTPQGLDQFQRPMTSLQTFTWSASGGTIDASGLFTAPMTATACTVTAKSGSVAGQANVTVQVNSTMLQNAALSALVSSLDADGSISRLDMLQILRSVGADNVVTAAEFSDLKKLLALSGTLNIPVYVQALAGDVINGNVANAIYQGKPLGNLAAGGSGAQLNALIGKWFLGADHPALCNTSLVYKTAAGSLFPHAPTHADEYQGQLGDCYFISALGTLADSNPAAIKNMFIDNGDGTYTVRFYAGSYGTIYNYGDGSISAGFSNNLGTADYVTVDRMLPASSTGILAYADYGASCTNSANSLWIPLAEKAYAQWNETRKEGRDGLNAYASIQGGWMATVDAQALGYNATDYIMTSTSKQVAINALAAKKAVTIGTLQWSGTVYGLYASHAYAIVGYNAAADKFTLYNPWGSNQPGALTWSQLQATCSQMAVADTSGTIPIGTTAVKSASVAALFSNQASAAAGIPLSESAAATAMAAGLASDAALGRSLPAAANNPSPNATGAWRELFWILEKSEAERSHQTRLAGSERYILSANLIDATFADLEFLSQSRV